MSWRNQLRISFLGAITVAAMLAPANAQNQPYKAPRTADGKPNLNGIWQAMNTANWDVEGHSAQAGQVVALGARAPSRRASAWWRAARFPIFRRPRRRKKKITRTG